MMDLESAVERRRELLREAEGRRLVREARRSGDDEPIETGVGVRWGLAEDEAAVADLLELNGLPRWVAFEERFIVVERDGRVSGALRYRTESKRLLLGLLVVDPWAGERRTARALYSGSVRLGRELGVSEVLAASGADYPGQAGYSRSGRGWRSTASSGGWQGRGEDRWRGALGLWGARATLPFRRVFR